MLIRATARAWTLSKRWNAACSSPLLTCAVCNNFLEHQSAVMLLHYSGWYRLCCCDIAVLLSGWKMSHCAAPCVASYHMKLSWLLWDHCRWQMGCKCILTNLCNTFYCTRRSKTWASKLWAPATGSVAFTIWSYCSCWYSTLSDAYCPRLPVAT